MENIKRMAGHQSRQDQELELLISFMDRLEKIQEEISVMITELDKLYMEKKVANGQLYSKEGFRA